MLRKTWKMAWVGLRGDRHWFVHYYHSQVWGNLNFSWNTRLAWSWQRVCISKLFCFLVPLAKGLFAIAAPYLKSAIINFTTVNITLGVFTHAMGKIVNNNNQKQEGSRGITVLSRTLNRKEEISHEKQAIKRSPELRYILTQGCFLNFFLFNLFIFLFYDIRNL